MIVNFGYRLNFIRNSLGLSEEQLAEKSGVHAATIKKIERRGNRPNLSTIIKLARAMNLQPSMLLGVGE